MGHLIHSVVFDIGGVFLDWDPRHLYRRLLPDEDAVEHFLAEVCTPEWHAHHDRGLAIAQGCEDLVKRFPHYSDLIWAWLLQGEMIGGVIAGMVELLEALRGQGVQVFALTNWPAESFSERQCEYEFLNWFDGVVVSGREGIIKPDPALFLKLIERYNLDPVQTLFVDDSTENIHAARDLGFWTHRFTNAPALRMQLRLFCLLAATNE